MLESELINTEAVLDALRGWHSAEGAGPLGQTYQARNLEPAEAPTHQFMLARAIRLMQASNPEGSRLLLARFRDREEVLALAGRLSVSEGTLLYRQRQAIRQMTEVLLGLEKEAQSHWLERMQRRLPAPTYGKLVGMEDRLQEIIDGLTARRGRNIVAIDGIGGIGKTALATEVVRRLINGRYYDEVAWVTTKQHRFLQGRLEIRSDRPALTVPGLLDELAQQFELDDASLSQLSRRREVRARTEGKDCLIVIDNLETVADYQSLLPTLRSWRASRVILTSRHRLLHEPGMWTVSLGELDLGAATELIRFEAKLAGFDELEQASDADLAQLYATIGGNPLAIKLAISQLRFHSFSRVIGGFTSGVQFRSQEELFDFIYTELWESLADESKATLLALAHSSGSGFDFEHLLAVTGLPENLVHESLEELILMSLVDVGGTLAERRYSVHRLTELFLSVQFGQ